MPSNPTITEHCLFHLQAVSLFWSTSKILLLEGGDFMSHTFPLKEKKREWSAPGIHDIVYNNVATRIVKGGQVLDIACGPGALPERFVSNGFVVTAADGFPEVFQLHGHVPFVQLNVEDEWTPLDKEFDAICAIEIIEHVENPYLFIRKCFRVLKPGGILVITTPNAAHYNKRLKFFIQLDSNYIHLVASIQKLKQKTIEFFLVTFIFILIGC